MSVFFVATAHDEYRTRRFPEGSVVIDPWRMIPDQPGVTVRRLGENKPAMISVLVPSRGRPDGLARTVRTAFETATHGRRVEFVVRLDDDDPEELDYTVDQTIGLSLPTVKPHPVTVLRGPRILLSEAWNECYAEASGEIVMHGGDDLVFTTPGWDQRVRDTFAAIPDRIGLVYADDLSTNFPELATHAFLHRRWVEAVGYFLPPLFSCDWNDVWISEVATKLGRLFPLPDVVIEHAHYSFGKRPHDVTDAEREERGRDDDVVGLYQRTAADRKRDTLKLKAVMA